MQAQRPGKGPRWKGTVRRVALVQGERPQAPTLDRPIPAPAFGSSAALISSSSMLQRPSLQGSTSRAQHEGLPKHRAGGTDLIADKKCTSTRHERAAGLQVAHSRLHSSAARGAPNGFPRFGTHSTCVEPSGTLRQSSRRPGVACSSQTSPQAHTVLFLGQSAQEGPANACVRSSFDTSR